MKLILYIGHHKVGSTALQTFLAQNQMALLRAGILYPQLESEGMSDLLARLLSGSDPQDVPQINVREPHNALAFRMMTDVTGNKMPTYHRNLPSTAQMLQALRKQVRLLQPHTVILCSEVMSNFAQVDPTLVARLKRLFPKAEVELYCTLRRPDEYLASWYGQRLKFGHKIAPLRAGGALSYVKGIHFDYRLMLTPWLDIFPKARLHIRNYADVLAAGGSVQDFTGQVDVAFPTGLPQPSRANPSLPYATMEIMRQGNHVLSQGDSRKLRRFLLTSAEQIPLPGNGDIELFGRDTRAELHRTFAPIQDFLSRFSAQGRFFPDLDEMLQDRAIPDLEASQDLLPQLRSKAGGTPEIMAILDRIPSPVSAAAAPPARRGFSSFLARLGLKTPMR